MKLWVDDIRPAPDKSWTVVRTVTSAINALYHFSSEISEISLDHDISHYENLDETDVDQKTYACAETFLPVAIAIGLIRNQGMYLIWGVKWEPKVTIHSSNPDGGENMQGILAEYGIEAELKPMGLWQEKEA